MKIYVAITDNEWVDFLRNSVQEIHTDINFWRPGSNEFRAIEAGDLFLFKRHTKQSTHENGEIVGGAYFKEFRKMTTEEAWNEFKFGNGADSIERMRQKISDYRERNNLSNCIEIGCIVLSRPFFFEENNWIDSPSDWKKSIVSGKIYDTDDEIGGKIYDAVSSRLERNAIQEEQIAISIEEEMKKLPDIGEIRAAYVKVRVNQSIFREKLLKKYGSCCLCGMRNEKLLVASHIKPWAASSGEEKLDSDNGFLLCPNHDALFDHGLISFDDDGRIMISSKLDKDDISLSKIHVGMQISLNEGNREYLEYHRKSVFIE